MKRVHYQVLHHTLCDQSFRGEWTGSIASTGDSSAVTCKKCMAKLATRAEATLRGSSALVHWQDPTFAHRRNVCEIELSGRDDLVTTAVFNVTCGACRRFILKATGLPMAVFK